MIKVPLVDEIATMALGQRIACVFKQGGMVYLSGDLGMGKTTLTRAILNGLGYEGAVKSPTYTLVESYLLGSLQVHHFDLYRLSDPEELEWLGFRDYLLSNPLCLIEWPERGGGWLARPDVHFQWLPTSSGRLLNITIHTDRYAELSTLLVPN